VHPDLGRRDHAQFGVDLEGFGLRATDTEWTFGTGTPITGTVADLALAICGRQLPPGRIDGNLRESA
jgi:hypothetical protein